jgi:hypothetical protein
MERKQRGRQEKQKNKEDAQKYNHIHTATFDLEAVLPTPFSLVSQAYYKRKLSSYNFTVYSLSDGKGTCFLWNETDSYLKTKSPAQCKDLMSSNTDEDMLLSHKILVGPQSHSKGNKSLFHH